jgi:regulator of protease activity HflC (stomatin/prohibitin superfamily)
MSAPIGYPPGERLKRPPGANGSVENTQKHRLRAWWRRYRSRFFLAAFVTVFLVGYLAPRIFISVRSGQAGVLWKRFGQGTVTDLVYAEGFHVIPPWDQMAIYNLRVQHKEQSVTVLSTNGLSITVDVSVRYRPKLPLLGRLHQEVGPGYVDAIVLPEVRSLLRDLFGEYTPEEIYTTKRSLIQDSLTRAVSEIGESFIEVDDLLITNIRLPSMLQEAIETKLTQEQRQLEMRFRIGREELEVDRKLIEAFGISGYNQVIAGSLTEQLLTFTGIGASLELAKSPNAKMVIFGNNQGLPLILDSRMLDSPPGTTNSAIVTNQVISPPSVEVAVTNINVTAAERILPRVRQWIQDSTNSFNKVIQALRRP